MLGETGLLDKSRLLISAHCDPLVFCPPNWLVNFVLKLMAPTIYRSLVKALNKAYLVDPTSPYKDRVKQKQIYSGMRTRIAESKAIECPSF